MFDIEYDCNNKSLKDISIENIFGASKVYQYMIDNKLNRLYLDEWLPNELGELYKFANKTGDSVNKYKGIEFISITKPSGGAGMGAYPKSVTICMLKDISK